MYKWVVMFKLVLNETELVDFSVWAKIWINTLLKKEKMFIFSQSL